MAITLPWHNFGSLSCSDPNMPKLSPMGSQNGHLGHYHGNEKRYNPETMLYPHKCSYFASKEEVRGYYLVKIPKCPNWAQWAAKMAFLANILGTGRDKTLKSCFDPWMWSFCVVMLVNGLCISFGIQDIPILKFGAQKRGFPKVDFGGLFWAFITHELPKKVLRPFTQFSLKYVTV